MTIHIDDLGACVEVVDHPTRVVSLVPSMTETLWWLHRADAVVARTDYCVAPPGAFPRAHSVRGTKNPDVRAIVDRSPDVVLANEEENRELDVRRLRDAGVAVYVTAPRTVAAAADSLEAVGAVVGARAAGADLAQAIRRALVRVESAGPWLRAFVPVWRDPWMATGVDTFAGDLLACAGFAVVPDAPRYPRVDLGEVRALDPDVVLLGDEPYPFGRSDRAAFTGWDVPVRSVDGTALTWWGPRTPHALGDLARLQRALGGGRRRRPAGARLAARRVDRRATRG